MLVCVSLSLTDIFTTRGRFVLSGKEVVSQEPAVLSDDDFIHLKDAANDSSSLYFVKAVTPSGSAVSYTRTCAIVESAFSCIITVYLDARGQFIGIGVSSSNPTCAAARTDPPVNGASNSNGNSVPSRKKASTLTTTVNVVQTIAGPQPDTQSYVQRLEQEKLEKMKGDRGDNRSFLAKYVSTAPASQCIADSIASCLSSSVSRSS